MRTIYSLNDHWNFRMKNESNSLLVNLPHTWNALEPQLRALHCYEKEIQIDRKHQGQELYLEFQGANSVCCVYLNDQLVGEHRGGYSTFRFSITTVYQWEGTNLLRVEVDNSPTEDVSPLMGDFTIYGGLYRSVNLICVHSNHFALDYYGSSGIILQTVMEEIDLGRINLSIHKKTVSSTITKLSIWQKDKQVLSCILSENELQKALEIENPILWDGKENPFLYELRASLVYGDEVYDEITISFGFRHYKLTADQGLFLNGKSFLVRGVSKHQDFEGGGNAITDEEVIKDFELIDEIGANAIRLSHYQHDEKIYDLCDSKGYLVWAEIPMLSMPKGEAVLENAMLQLKELVYQNCHHPSILFWGLQNEIAMGGESLPMYQSVGKLNDLFHEIYPKGISASANMYHVQNKSPLNRITDLLGYNLYYGWYYGEIKDLNDWFDRFHEDHPMIPLGLSEYGADSNLAFHSKIPKVKDYSEEFQALYHEETYEIIQSKPYLWGSFLWNMFDFGSVVRNEGGTVGKNCKGLVSFDRKVKKDAFYFYKAKWSKVPFVHLCEKRFLHRNEEKVTIKAYSNLSKLSLFVNELKVGELESEGIFRFHDVYLKSGENDICIRANAGDLLVEDRSRMIKVEEEDKSYIFVDPNPGFNVKNWFTQEVGEVDLFPEDKFSILDRVCDLMANKAAWEIVVELAPKIAQRATPESTVTLLWIMDKMRNFFTEEQVKSINQQLIQIDKN